MLNDLSELVFVHCTSFQDSFIVVIKNSQNISETLQAFFPRGPVKVILIDPVCVTQEEMG
jgi:hypothetical protein